MIESLVRARGVRVVRGGNTLLALDDFQVHPNEIVGVVGPNGSGKSTLVQVLGLLLEPEEGRVEVAGEAATRARARRLRHKLACVFQSPLLLDRSVRANVALGLRLRGVAPVERERRTEEWLAHLGLQPLAGRRALTLSGGEAQRVNLARAFALQPEVLLLDEPLSGLDAPTRNDLVSELGPLLRAGARAAVLVTHDRGEAMALCDRVAVLLEGRLRQVGPPLEVYQRPADVAVARFVGVENLLRGKAKGARVTLDGGAVLDGEAGQDGEVTVCLRAEEVRLSEPDGRDAGEAPWNRLAGRVIRVAPAGDDLLVEVDVGTMMRSRATRADLAILRIEPGKEVGVYIRPKAVHRIPYGMGVQL